MVGLYKICTVVIADTLNQLPGWEAGYPVLKSCSTWSIAKKLFAGYSKSGWKQLIASSIESHGVIARSGMRSWHSAFVSIVFCESFCGREIGIWPEGFTLPSYRFPNTRLATLQYLWFRTWSTSLLQKFRLWSRDAVDKSLISVQWPVFRESAELRYYRDGLFGCRAVASDRIDVPPLCWVVYPWADYLSNWAFIWTLGHQTAVPHVRCVLWRVL